MYYEVETLVNLTGKPSVYTYESDTELDEGSLVSVPFGKKILVGIVVRRVSKPDFMAKKIINTLSTVVVPHSFVEFGHWFANYYPTKNDEAAAMLLPKFLTTAVGKRPKIKPSTSDGVSQPPLSQDQTAVMDSLKSDNQPVILKGIVGSGKSRVYFEAGKQKLAKGQSVLILAPEIGLSSQIYKRASEFYGETATLHYHSNMTDRERRDIWYRCLETEEPLVVIGPRSALMLPYKKLGLVVVDEFHENAYKQMEQLHYHANDAAARLSQIHGAKLVYGSATPGVREYYFAKVRSYPILTMSSQATGNESQRAIELVDQKDRRNFSKNPYLSNQLIGAIEQAIETGEQTIILHNRRGTARSILCSKCAWSLLCPECDGNLVYHHDQNKCICHTCGHKTTLPLKCPDCGGIDILLKSLGTKALTLELEKLFPTARIARFDSDNSKLETLGTRYDEIEKGEIDILVGTQLLAKGLDLKRLSVVGITSADNGLTMPDFAAGERLFQMIAQAAGRVGRGHLDGKCFVQTYQPNAKLFEAVLNQDWDKFYESEIKERQEHLYPPFVFMLKLTCSRKTLKGAESAAQRLSDDIRQQYKGIKLVGPSSSYRGRERGLFVQQIIVKSKNRPVLLDIARNLPSGWAADIDPTSLL